MNTIQTLNRLFKPQGLRVRAFVVDYRDELQNEYNRESFIIGNQSDNLIIATLINEYDEQGFTVSTIHELLNGYSHEELEQIAKQDLREALEHLKLLYLSENI